MLGKCSPIELHSSALSHILTLISNRHSLNCCLLVYYTPAFCNHSVCFVGRLCPVYSFILWNTLYYQEICGE